MSRSRDHRTALLDDDALGGSNVHPLSSDPDPAEPTQGMAATFKGWWADERKRRYLILAVLLSLTVAILISLAAVYLAYRKGSEEPAGPTLSSTGSNPAPPASSTGSPPPPPTLNGTVHVVWSSHLDVGFATTSAAVIQEYWDEYYPRALNLSRALRHTATPYVYMTHAYVLGLLFDCPPNMGLRCPSEAAKADVARAIAEGDLTFHAFPFNAEFELYTRELFEAGIQSALDLADTYKRKGGRPTVISQRDVPGTTIGIIPSMVAKGVKGISIGANAASPPADVPTISIWRTAAGEQVYLMFHGGDYGGILRRDAVVIPGFPHVLLMQWNTDNSGPLSSAAQVEADYAQIQGEYPGFKVVASTFEQYLDLVDAAVQAGTIQLPVVTKEMGDTWSYGLGSDPRKTGEFLVTQQLHADCVRDPSCDSTSAEFRNFSRLLVKGGEHTWSADRAHTHLHRWSKCAFPLTVLVSAVFRGGDAPAYLGGYGTKTGGTPYFSWNNSEFAQIRSLPAYQALLYTWREQREWSVHFPLQALPPSHPIARAAPRRFASLRPPSPPSTTGMEPGKPGTWYTVGNLSVQLGADGGVAGLKLGSTIIADDASPFTSVVYQLFDDSDYAAFLNEYIACACDWAPWDFGKVGLSEHSSVGARTVRPLLRSFYTEQTSSYLRLLVNATFADPLYVDQAGAPAQLWIDYEVDAKLSRVSIQLSWFNKTSTRLPEALWLTFNSTQAGSEADVFRVNKLGVSVDPRLVLNNGSSHLHGSAYASQNSHLVVQPVNVPLLCMGEPTPFPSPLPQNDRLQSGVSYNLVNNIWGTLALLHTPTDTQHTSVALMPSLTDRAVDHPLHLIFPLHVRPAGIIPSPILTLRKTSTPRSSFLFS